MDYGSKLSDFIKQEILHGCTTSLDDDQDLLNAGIVDSLGILRLVSFIEEQFGVQVPDEDVVFENFQSIRAMSNYIAQRQAAV